MLPGVLVHPDRLSSLRWRSVRRACLVAASTLALLAPVIACAQTQPARPVTIVVPFPAEGGTDMVIRSIQHAAIRKLTMLDAAPTLGFMRMPPGNDLKQYDDAGHVRINQQWRLTFK